VGAGIEDALGHLSGTKADPPKSIIALRMGGQKPKMFVLTHMWCCRSKFSEGIFQEIIHYCHDGMHEIGCILTPIS
jgi:hypothetical protein